MGNGFVVVPGVPADSVVQLSDQKAGSILIFPFYGSDGTTANDTRLTITNVGPAGVAGAPAQPNSLGSTTDILNNLNVHLFWLDGVSCSQADGYVCFTKFQSWTFKASEWDPVTPRGVLIAVAVDPMGYPISYNGLIGNAFVNCNVTQSGVTEKWLDNYGAEAFSSLGVTLNALPNGQVYWYSGSSPNINPASPANPSTLTALIFDSLAHNGQAFGYDQAPGGFAVEFQSPADAVGQTILTVGLNGSIGSALGGNAYVSGVGLIYRNDEKEYSFTGTGAGCQILNRITATNPRVVGGLGTQIPSGRSGTAAWGVGGAVGLFITPASANNRWSGIRGLHKTRAGLGALTMPVFMPTCVL